MESNFVDKAVLGEFIDAIISAKYPDRPADDLIDIREESIRILDHQILKDILGHLTKEQGAELNQLLKNKDADEATFDAFWSKNQIDVSGIIEKTMVSFKDEFMKGEQNA